MTMHLNAFWNRFELKGDNWLGHNVKDWAYFVSNFSAVINSDVMAGLPNKRLNRADLFEFQADEGLSDLQLTICILAWGGMNRKHGVSALSSWHDWNMIIRDLRSACVSRSEAYAFFKEKRQGGFLSGMGPAYFTKLIFFSHPNHDGYIMDQWTARSANLLGLSPSIEMYGAGVSSGSKFMGVSDKNTAAVYESFCKFLEALADTASSSIGPMEVEEAMFSLGRGRGAWRNYVVSCSS